MIAAMLNFPTHSRTVLLVVIEKENLDRMRQADPITLESVRDGGALPVPLFPMRFSMLIAYEEDDAELYRLARLENKLELLTYLERGRKWDPKVDGKRNAFKL